MTLRYFQTLQKIDISKYLNFGNKSENDSLEELKEQARSSYWNQRLNMDNFGFGVATRTTEDFYLDLEKAKECFAMLVLVEEPCRLYLAARDKDDEWTICDGDPLYLYGCLE